MHIDANIQLYTAHFTVTLSFFNYFPPDFIELSRNVKPNYVLITSSFRRISVHIKRIHFYLVQFLLILVVPLRIQPVLILSALFLGVTFYVFPLLCHAVQYLHFYFHPYGIYAWAICVVSRALLNNLVCQVEGLSDLFIAHCIHNVYSRKCCHLKH